MRWILVVKQTVPEVGRKIHKRHSGWLALGRAGLGGGGSVVVGEARALDVTATHLCQGKGSVSLFLNILNHIIITEAILGAPAVGLTTTW